MAPIYSPIGCPFPKQMDAHLEPKLVIKTRARAPEMQMFFLENMNYFQLFTEFLYSLVVNTQKSKNIKW